MKILKHILLTGIFSCASFLAFAQGAYLKLGGGYNYGTGYRNGITMDNNNLKRVKISYGKGIDGEFAFGYMFNSSIGAEIGAGYLIGSKFLQNVVRYSQQGGSIIEITEQYKHFSRMLFLKPAFVLSTNRAGLNPYGKFGAITGIGKIYEYYNNQAEGTTSERELELKGGVALGAFAALGAEYRTESKFSFFAEAEISNLNYSPTKGEVTNLTFNGKDYLSNTNVAYRESEYVSELPNDSSNSDKNKPTKLLKSSHPFSAAGLNLGIKFTF